MENDKFKLTVLYILFLISVLISSLLFIKSRYEYLIIFVSVSVILLISIIYELKAVNSTPEQIYRRTVSKVIKVYNPILVSTDKFPKLKNKSILKTSSLDDLIDAQSEIRKPIYYINSDASTAFYLINDDVFLIYFIKLNNNVTTSLENELKVVELNSSINFDDIKDLDKTVIVQTDEKSYRVSPIRKEEKDVKNKEENVKKTEEKNSPKKKSKKSNKVKREVIFE